jgi:hypothetical protein
MKAHDNPSQGLENRKTKRTIWFRGQYVPILYSSDRASGFGGKNWIARGATQRIGATLFATVFFCASIALFVASIFVRSQIAETTGGVLGQVFGTAFAVFAFLVGCFALLMTFRLARSVVRSFHM